MSNINKVKYPVIRDVVTSTYLDVLGAVLILSICIYKNFHGTIFFEGSIKFGIPFSELMSYVKQGAYPLGILSTVGAVFSMLATRFVSKQKNSGNAIGIVTTVNSGANDFLFGNGSAIITYPITFLVHAFAFRNWATGEKIKPRDKYYYIIIAVGMLVAFSLVYIGAYLFQGRTDSSFLFFVGLTFGLSLGATICNAFKYEETWYSWMIYNIVNLTKNIMQVNIANVVKYVFYLFNAAFALVDWKYNGDR